MTRRLSTIGTAAAWLVMLGALVGIWWWGLTQPPTVVIERAPADRWAVDQHGGEPGAPGAPLLPLGPTVVLIESPHPQIAEWHVLLGS